LLNILEIFNFDLSSRVYSLMCPLLSEGRAFESKMLRIPISQETFDAMFKGYFLS